MVGCLIDQWVCLELQCHTSDPSFFKFIKIQQIAHHEGLKGTATSTATKTIIDLLFGAYREQRLSPKMIRIDPGEMALRGFFSVAVSGVS